MNYTKTHTGMTFIELLVWMSLLGIISVTMIGMVTFFYRRDRDLVSETSGSQSVRKTVDKIVKDIREATFAHNGAFVIAAMSPYELTFYSDTDRDDATERIRYYVTGTTFNRGVVNPTGNPPVYTPSSELVTMISTAIMNQTNSVPMFRYYNSAGSEITDMTRIGEVAYIDVKVLVNRAPFFMTPRITEIKTSVSFRNPPGI
jgi:Tfp pilus assembly protein PilW